MTDRSRQTANSIVETIGHTPLVELGRITANIDGRILAKLEYLNPGLSKKDRAALRIIEEAEHSGDLHPGQTVIELTSGNMGTGLAIVCAVKGYPFVAVMSKGNSEERARMMRAFGAEVVLVDQCPGSKAGEVSGDDLQLVDAEAIRLSTDRGAFRADQFGHKGNLRAHYYGTAPEIWQQCDGDMDAFCDFAGSGGTFAGCAKFFREKNPDIQCYVVEPDGAAALSGASVTTPDHPIQGGGYAMPELSQLDGIHPRRLPECFIAATPSTVQDDWRKRRASSRGSPPAQTWLPHCSCLPDLCPAQPLPSLPAIPA